MAFAKCRKRNVGTKSLFLRIENHNSLKTPRTSNKSIKTSF